jgi:hypothetical protein
MKTHFLFHLWLPVFFGIAFTINPVFGQVMLSPVSAATDIVPYNSTVPVGNLINHSGVTTPFTNGVTVFDTYFANPNQFATSGNNGTNNWQSVLASGFGYQGIVEFDLGAVYKINQLAVWNKSLSNITVVVLADLGGTEQVAGNFDLPDQQSSFFSYRVTLLPFNATYQGRYVRLVINSIYPVPGFNFGYAIAGEVVASVLPVVALPPTVNVFAETNGDVTVTFTGTLQTSTVIGGTFTNVPGSPSNSYTLPKASLLPQQFFRAQGD